MAPRSAGLKSASAWSLCLDNMTSVPVLLHFRKSSNGIHPTNILSARTSVWESIAIQETEEVNLTPESQQQSRRNIQINSVSQQSLNMSLHSAKRRHDILNVTVSLIMDKRKDFSLCIYEFSPIIFKLVRLVVRLYLDWKADLFFITLGHSLRSQRFACKLMVSEKN